MVPDVSRVAVFGGGSWGTAFANILAEAGNTPTIWARRSELAETINSRHENPDYLPGINLHPSVTATSDFAVALDGAAIVVLAIPSQSLRDNLSAWAPALPPDALLLSLMKGIELGSTKRMSEVIREVGDVPEERVAVLSGPNLAREIAHRQPAASVIACADERAAVRLQEACMTAYFRPYTNTDVVGTELGGAVKNVIAIACGMAEGMGFGDNTKASLITRGLTETTRLGDSVGARPLTFMGLAGLGDLVATCTSPLSRNRTLGEKLGRGMSLKEVQRNTRTVAEGVSSSRSVLDLARKHDIDMPITEGVVSVVHDGLAPTEMVRRFMSREARPEAHDA